MDKRFFLALLLTGVVLVVTPLIVPSARRPVAPAAVTEPAAAVPSPAATNPTVPSVIPAPGSGAARPAAAGGGPAPTIVAESTLVKGAGAVLTLSSVGAALDRAEIAGFVGRDAKGGPVTLQSVASPLLRYTIIAGRDTIVLDRVPFAMEAKANGVVRFTSRDPATPVTVEYDVPAAGTLTRTIVQFGGATSPAYLLISLPRSFESHEADSLDDIRHLSYAAKPVGKSATGVAFSSLDPGEHKLLAGPMSWAVAKNKYFLVGVLSPSDSTPFAEVQLTGGARASRLATLGEATVVIPLASGRAAFDVYAGPQSWERLRAIGRDFETANPYGGFMQPVVQPFATIVMRLMLWLKRAVQLDYGWVLVIFGLAIRILLWPLNQSAMRSSIRLQRIQPELTEVQQRYKNDPQKQQQEIMRVYREHNMSPFSALSGCLPALIPMPVFFALFFVFQNTIEFRGVPFLWLADISLKDPFYILPIVTGGSMFLLSWIGMRNMPKNPQATTMLYLMPAMFTMFLLNTASGLSIYYLVQQIAAIPQQWLIANERRKASAAG